MATINVSLRGSLAEHLEYLKTSSLPSDCRRYLEYLKQNKGPLIIKRLFDGFLTIGRCTTTDYRMQPFKNAEGQ